MQYIIYPFDSVNTNYFNAKPKPLTDKTIPETLVSLKFAKKHVETQEAKDRIIRDAIDGLTLYLAANSSQLAFPEMFVPVGVLLRKFKKNCKNPNYRKTVSAFLDLVKRNEDKIADARSKIRDKSLKDPARLHQ